MSLGHRWLLIAVALVIACGSPVARARADLDSPDPEKRIAAVKALGKAKDKTAVPKLIELLEDEDADVRKQTARALGKIGAAEAVGPFAEMYEREEYRDVADAAVRALIRLGQPSVKFLIGLLGSIKPDIRAGAARALGKLEAGAAVDRLIRLIDDRNPDVRIAAIYALRQIGDEQGLDAIARAVKDVDPDVEAAAERALSGRGYESQLDKAKRIIRRRPR